MKILSITISIVLIITGASALSTIRTKISGISTNIGPDTFLLKHEDLSSDRDLEDYHNLNATQYRMERLRSLNDALKWFSTRLRSFITGLSFDTAAFQIEEPDLCRQFSEIAEWALSFGNNQELEKKVNFARCFLWSIKISSEYLDYFKADRKDHQLVRNIVKLNLRILTLHTISGFANSKIRGFEDILERLTSYVNLWQSSFRKLSGVELSVRILFENQISEANRVLKGLRGSGKKQVWRSIRSQELGAIE